MNDEKVVFVLIAVAVALLILIIVVLWFKEYKVDDCIESSDYMIDDFYTHSKEK